MTEIIDINDDTFEKEILDNNGPVLVDFWADWCAPCKQLVPIIEEISNNYSGKMKVCKANLNDNGDAISKYGIKALPTLCIFKKGQIVSKIVGIRSLKNIIEDVEKALV